MIRLVDNFDFKQQLIFADSQSRITAYKDRYYSFAFHPLRDYLGNKDQTRNNIGAIFIARDITKSITAYNEEQWVNILYGITAYVIIEILLLLTFLSVTRNLTKQVKQQTAELIEQKSIIEQDKLKYKNLAEAINNRYFFYTRTKNNKLTSVSPSIEKVIVVKRGD